MPSSDGDPDGAGGESVGRSETGTFAVDEGAAGAIAIDAESAGPVFDALSSATGRTVLARLYDRARTPSEIADALETSVQNVSHHVAQLSEAGLVEVTGTRDSGQGRSMNVYAPTSEALVLYASGDAEPPRPAAGGEPDVDAGRETEGAYEPAAGTAGPSAGFERGDDAGESAGLWFSLGALVGSAAVLVWRAVTGGTKS